MVYGDGLENRCRCKPTVGSNPTPSAILNLKYENKLRLKYSESETFSLLLTVC